MLRDLSHRKVHLLFCTTTETTKEIRREASNIAAAFGFTITEIPLSVWRVSKHFKYVCMCIYTYMHIIIYVRLGVILIFGKKATQRSIAVSYIEL